MIVRPLPLALRPIALALSSAFLLVASFPSFNQPWCAWIALVPWLLLLHRVSSRTACWWSWLIGFLFFLGSMGWLLQVAQFGAAAILGWLVLGAYLALYVAAFGWVVRRCCLQPPAFNLKLLVIPAAWVALEYARSHLLTGLGWNLLAYSQTSWLPMIQFADVTGAWGVSFLIVSVNVVVAGCLEHCFRHTPNPEPRTPNRAQSALWSAAIAGGAVLLALGYGTRRLAHLPIGASVRIAVVQGNIPQEHKWDEAYQAKIKQRYAALTDEVARSQPDLIVWPETSVPGFFDADEALTQWVSGVAARAKCSLLIGAPIPTIRDVRVTLTNSAVLLNENGMMLQRYDKLHLVPFGEFIPFERRAPWLRNLLPPIGDFVPGRKLTVFHLGSRLKAQGSRQLPSSLQPSAFSLQLPFSVLICFEDVFPDLARRFVLEGARLLVVITNDAWFGPTAAAYQHAQASIFRAVELRVPVARAANTGWSGCIDASGRQIGSVHDEQGRELFVQGTHACELPLSDASSLYRRAGDWFALLCFLVSAGWLGFAHLRR